MVAILGYYTYEKKEKLESEKDPNSPAAAEGEVDAPIKLDIGESIPGHAHRFKLLVKNEHPRGRNIELRDPTTTDKDLKVEQFPSRLKHGESGVIEFLYTPSKSRIDPLEAKWSFTVVVG